MDAGVAQMVEVGYIVIIQTNLNKPNMPTLTARQLAILESLESGEKSVGELVVTCDVSEMSIRRDLAALESASRIERTWGGARLADRQLLDLTFRGRVRQREKEKAQIGQRVAQLVPEGATVMIDTGTTTLAVARALRGRKGLRVLTCSLPIVAEFLDCPGITCDMLGGTVRTDSLELYGPLTERNFEGLRADIVILGTDAIAPDGGLYTMGMETARVAELIMHTSRRRILAADSSKWDRTASSRYAHISAMTTVVSDSQLPQARRAAVRSADTELVIV